MTPLSAQQVSPDFSQDLSWRLIGPHRGGRVSAVAGIANDSKTYYIGMPNGGIWKTTNGGVTWFPVFDEARVASIGDLVVAPSNPNVIYAATGEQTPGNGVWKSIDGGATWTNIGLKDSTTIFSILVDPRDANVLYVAAFGDFASSESRGIFKTLNGGKSWRKVFYKDDHTSATELCFDPNNSRTLYAVTRRIVLPPAGAAPPQPEKKPAEELDSALLRSTDAGETWTSLDSSGLPPTKRGRVGIAVARGLSGKRVFAIMNQGLFRSDDGGATWKQITNDPRVVGNDYFARVFADTKNPEIVYVVQTSTYRSVDGGKTFEAWRGTPSGEDDHVLWIAPEDPNRILMGTDQGATITLDGGKSWSSWFNQATGQFYRVSTDNDFPYRLYASQQDSGSIVVPSRSDYGLITYREWFPSGSFESAFIAPDPVNPNYIYSVGWYGPVIRMDRTTGQVATLFYPPTTYRTVWETPIVFSPQDPRTIYYGSQFLLKSSDLGFTWKEISGDLTLKPGEAPAAAKPAGGGHQPSKDADDGDAPDSDPYSQQPGHGSIQAIAPSPLDANLIWVGTTSGLIQVTHDGTTWSDVTPTGLPLHPYINSIEASHHDANVAYAAVFAGRTRFLPAINRYPDAHPTLFRTRDGGKTWEKIVNGLPESGVTRVVREDPVRKGLLFAGTETGIYVSFDFGDHWQPLQLNLPTTTVNDLAIHGADLVAATFGRGLYILDNISPLRQWPRENSTSAVNFFTPEPATRIRWDNHPDTPLQPDMPASQNPPDGALLDYFLPVAAKGEVTLDILDEKGTHIRHFSSAAQKEVALPANVPEFWFSQPASLSAAAGAHRFVWDLRYPAPVTLPYSYYGELLEYVEYSLPDHAVPGATPRMQPPGPLVPPGKYALVLAVDGKSYRQQLQVNPDPRVHISQADFAAQSDLSLRISDWMTATANSFDSVEALQKEFDARKKSIAANAPKELSDAMAALEISLTAFGKGTDDHRGFGGLNRDLARYLVMVQSADIAPTESARKVSLSACTSYSEKISDWNKFNAEQLPALNKLLAAQKLATLSVAAAPTSQPSCAP